MIKSHTDGFALITVLLVFAVVFTLGSAILFATTSEHRFTTIDGHRQSAYYIAESGIYLLESDIKQWINANQSISGNDFFTAFENEFAYSERNYNHRFQENSLTSLEVKLRPINEELEANQRLYQVTSKGSVNGFERVLYHDFEMRKEDESNDLLDNLSLSAQSYDFSTGSVKATGSAVLGGLHSDHIRGDTHIDITRLYFKESVEVLKGSIKLGAKENGKIYAAKDVVFEKGNHQIYSEMHVKGNLKLTGVTLHQNVFVEGDLIIGEGLVLSNDDIQIYYGGELRIDSRTPQDLQSYIQTETFENWEMPYQKVTLKHENWYRDHDYTVDTSSLYESAVDTVNGSSLYVKQYSHSNWIGKTQKPVIIISQGDIKIHVGSDFYGALIAPQGKVEITNGESFKGIIVAGKGLDVKGNCSLDLITPAEMWDEIGEIPFEITTFYESNDSKLDSDLKNKSGVHFNRTGRLRDQE